MQLSAPAASDLQPHHLSVDGMSPQGPNLSHWPGNRTPRKWKRDLSTGICLAFARAPEEERTRFLDGAEQVLNDHYDTDGFGSLLTILRPDLALAREDLLLGAAATGDFQVLGSGHGFAVDRIVMNLADPLRSPVAGLFAGMDGGERDLARYEWLLEHAEGVLDRPQDYAGLWHDEYRLIVDEVQAALNGAVERELHPETGLAVVVGSASLHRMALNTIAGAWRVLHATGAGDSFCYRYHDRTESWFEVVTFTPMPRVDLRPLAEILNEMDPEVTGPTDTIRWAADPPDAPVPELYRGIPAPQEYARVTRELVPTSMSPDMVGSVVRRYLLDQR